MIEYIILFQYTPKHFGFPLPSTSYLELFFLGSSLNFKYNFKILLMRNRHKKRGTG